MRLHNSRIYILRSNRRIFILVLSSSSTPRTSTKTRASIKYGSSLIRSRIIWWTCRRPRAQKKEATMTWEPILSPTLIWAPSPSLREVARRTQLEERCTHPERVWTAWVSVPSSRRRRSLGCSTKRICIFLTDNKRRFWTNKNIGTIYSNHQFQNKTSKKSRSRTFWQARASLAFLSVSIQALRLFKPKIKSNQNQPWKARLAVERACSSNQDQSALTLTSQVLHCKIRLKQPIVSRLGKMTFQSHLTLKEWVLAKDLKGLLWKRLHSPSHMTYLWRSMTFSVVNRTRLGAIRARNLRTKVKHAYSSRCITQALK